MDFFYSLRFRLTVICLFTITIPLALQTFLLPVYYQNMISAETKTLTESTLTSLVKNIETYLDDLERITLNPYRSSEYLNALIFRTDEKYEDSEQYDMFKTTEAISNMLENSLRYARRDITCCLFATNSNYGYLVTKDGMSMPRANYRFTDQCWYKDAVKANGNAVFISAHAQEYLAVQPVNKVFSVARLLKNPESQKPLGVIMADADTIVLNRILGDVALNVSSIISIFDKDKNLIYSTHEIHPEAIAQIRHHQPVINNSSTEYVIVTKAIERVNWEIVVLLSDSEMKSKLRFAYTIGFLFAIAASVIILSLFSTLTLKITSPFKKIGRFIRQVESGNLKARIGLKGRDEISKLAMSLDNMACQLDDLIDREYKLALSKRNAEYHALQSQINPHFLYNTLTGFLGLNRLKKHGLLEKSIVALTGLMRYTLDQKDFSSVKEECLMLERYCSLQKLRFEDRLEYSIEYDVSVADCRIPKLLLQPLVENSIIHGIEPLDRPGKIIVKAFKEDNENISYLKIIVDDDGVGFDTNLIDMEKSVGISNARTRLLLLFPEAEFAIYSLKGRGTHIILKIPEGEISR